MRRIILARAGGFTFVELLVAMAVVVVLTGVGMPVLGRAIEKYRVGMAIRDVERDLQAARLKAVSSNHPIRVRFNCPSAGFYRVVELIGEAGAPVAEDDRPDAASQALYPYPAADLDPLTRPNHDGPLRQLPPSVSFRSSQTLEFWPDGSVHTGGGGGRVAVAGGGAGRRRRSPSSRAPRRAPSSSTASGASRSSDRPRADARPPATPAPHVQKLPRPETPAVRRICQRVADACDTATNPSGIDVPCRTAAAGTALAIVPWHDRSLRTRRARASSKPSSPSACSPAPCCSWRRWRRSPSAANARARERTLAAFLAAQKLESLAVAPQALALSPAGALLADAPGFVDFVDAARAHGATRPVAPSSSAAGA